jgi:hypothetical protein
MKSVAGKSKAMMPKGKMASKANIGMAKEKKMPSYKKGGMVKKGGCK